MEVKLKICHFTSVHSCLDIRIFYKECVSLARVGHRVHYIVPDGVDGCINGVYIHGVPVAKKSSRFVRMFFTAWKVYLCARKQQADVYHFHDPELLFYGLLLQWQGARVIYDVHEDVPRDILSKTWIPQYLRRVIAWGAEIFENFVAARLAAVVTATPHINRRFLLVNRHSVNINNYPLCEEFVVCAGVKDKQRVVCYAGGISSNRGLFQMLEAIALTDVTLLLAGEIDSEVDKKKMTAMPGWRQARALGRVGRDMLPSLFSRSVAGLVLFLPDPNHINAQPNKIFEYMSAGIPVIASDFPLWRELIEGSACGICVDPLDSAEISRAILWLIDHPEEALRMGENGRMAVESRYNWEAEAIRLIQFYEEVEQCAA